MKRDKSFDFVRAICALGIVAFHFSCHLREGVFLPFLSNGNVSWGQTFKSSRSVIKLLARYLMQIALIEPVIFV